MNSYLGTDLDSQDLVDSLCYTCTRLGHSPGTRTAGGNLHFARNTTDQMQWLWTIHRHIAVEIIQKAFGKQTVTTAG